MLTVHGVTFRITWSGWGAQTYLVERAAEMEMFDLLQKSAEQIAALAKYKRLLAQENRGLRYAARKNLYARNKPVPINGVILLEVMK